MCRERLQGCNRGGGAGFAVRFYAVEAGVALRYIRNPAEEVIRLDAHAHPGAIGDAFDGANVGVFAIWQLSYKKIPRYGK